MMIKVLVCGLLLLHTVVKLTVTSDVVVLTFFSNATPTPGASLGRQFFGHDFSVEHAAMDSHLPAHLRGMSPNPIWCQFTPHKNRLLEA